MADIATSHALIGTRRARSLAEAGRRSFRVRALRYGLLLGALVVVANVGAQLVLTNQSGVRGLEFAPAGSNERIVNPRFTGRDDGGAPFTVTAQAAVRRAGGVVGLAELERPSLDYAFLQADAVSEVLARTGVFDEAEQTLLLQESVSFATSTGYSFSTDAALIRLREGRVEGDSPVTGMAPWGAVRANAFDVRDDGRRIIMTGDVRTRFYLADTEGAQP